MHLRRFKVELSWEVVVKIESAIWGDIEYEKTINFDGFYNSSELVCSE